MASDPVDKTQFQTLAPSYLTVNQLPYSQLQGQLIASTLGDCTSLSVLNLAGSAGFHARRAIVDANAALVDVVDISAEMIRSGQSSTEKRLGIEQAKRVRWYEGSLSYPFEIPNLQQEYDVVMANWLDIVRHLKPGGKSIGARALNPKVGYLSAEKKKGKYGMMVADVEEKTEVRGKGLRCLVAALTEPERFVRTSLEDSMLMRD
ncbi:hypothetical protein QBC36DRAFT_299617 [Triangularia setosa]|uniref:Methyltransferase domain-containing protein n=1 Tax=Triangularia setosa TaxID=2587417 RepID=A0AAN6W9Z9_9PEZI|nr:hypothetical protein QBC36DRAFT_299617 [Podospora setosa]